MSIAEKVKAKYVTAIDAMELAVRMAERYHGLKRPPGATAEEAFDRMPDEIQHAWGRAANAAMDYFKEQIDGLKQTN